MINLFLASADTFCPVPSSWGLTVGLETPTFVSFVNWEFASNRSYAPLIHGNDCSYPNQLEDAYSFAGDNLLCPSQTCYAKANVAVTE